MKKVLALTLSTVFLAGLLAACGGDSSSTAAPASTAPASSMASGGDSSMASGGEASGIIVPEEETTVAVLTFLTPANEFFVNAMIDAAENLENINVEANVADFGVYLEQSQLALSGAKSNYHLIYSYNEYYPRQLYDGWLAPVDEYIEKYAEEYDTADIYDAVLDVVTSPYDGGIYCIPYQQNLPMFTYRTDIFEDLSIEVPTTLDEWFTALDTIEAAGVIDYPAIVSMAAPDILWSEFLTALQSHGGEFFDENNYPIFNGPEGVAAVEFLMKLMEYMPDSILTDNIDTITVGLQQGAAATSNLFATRLASLEDEEVSQTVGQWATAPALVMEGVDIPHTLLAIDMWVIPENIDISPEIPFVVAMESLRYETALEAAPLSISIRQSVLNDPEVIEMYPYYQSAADTIANGVLTMPLTPAAGVVNEMVSYWLGQALAGQVGIQEALDSAAEEITEELKVVGYITE